MTIETGSGTARPFSLRSTAALPVYAFLAATLVLIASDRLTMVSHESGLIALLLNTLVVATLSAAGAWIAGRAYLATGLHQLLLAGCGLVAIGSSFVISGLIIGGEAGPNDAVTVHNLGALLAASFHLAAANAAGAVPHRNDPSASRVLFPFLGSLALTLFFWVAATHDMIPAFYIDGKGPTPVRQLTLALAIAFMAVAAGFILRQSHLRPSAAMRYYGLGLVLFALGLTDVSIAAPGSVLSWAGRASQSVGSAYLLAAFMTAIRTAAQQGADVKEMVADYFTESEDHFRRLVNALRAAVISLDPQGRVVLWNPLAEIVFGCSGAEAVGRRLTDLIAVDGNTAFRQLLEKRTAHYEEVVVRTKSGRDVPVEVSVFEAGVGLTKWTNLIVRDISDRRQIEDELRNRDLRLRQALQVSRSFSFEWDPATDKVARSMECGPLLGLHGDEATQDTGRKFFQRVHPEDRERFSEVIRALTPERPSYTTTYRIVRPDGGLLTLEETALGFFDAGRGLNLLTGISTDVTERERSREAVQYLASFPELNPNPIVEIDTDGKVRFCNPTAQRLFPDLRQGQREHPWLARRSDALQSMAARGSNQFETEVAIGDQWYHQTFSYLPESKCCRIYGLDVTELKSTEQRLLENQADLSWAQAVGRIGSWRLNVRRNELLWSDENHRIFGLPKGTSMSYETFLGIVHPEDQGYVDGKWQAALRGEPYDIEHRIVAGNLVKWVRERAELEFDAAGQLLGGFGITQDITDRKLTEAALRESEARFRLLAATAGQLLTAEDPQRQITELATRVMDHLKCDCFFNFLVSEERADFLRLNAWAGIPAEEARRIEWLNYGVAVCGCVARDRERIVAEHISITSDARTDLVKSYGIRAYACHPLIGINGKLLGTLSFGTRRRDAFSEEDLGLMKAVSDQVAVALVRLQNAMDLRLGAEALRMANESLEEKVRKRTVELESTVTALKDEIHARKQVQAQLHQLSRVFMDAADPILIEDLEGTVVEMNREAETIYGWSREELIGRSIETLILPGQRDTTDEWRERCRCGEEIRNWEELRIAKSGRLIPTLLTAFPLMDDSGQMTFIASISKDISARKAMEAQITDAHRHLRELSRKSLDALEADRRTVGRELHDSIGGSLAAIKFGLEDVAERVSRGPGAVAAQLKTLISHLTDAIKETKRISAYLRPLTIDDLGLLATIEGYTRQFSQRYEAIRLVCQVDVDEKEIPEEFKIVLYRVMQEALTNAARHSQADTVSLRLTKDDSRFELEIVDNGCGFVPGEAVDGRDGLSGFGLKSMQERAEICGGCLTLRTRPGEGTSVKISLPLSPTPPVDRTCTSPTEP